MRHSLINSCLARILTKTPPVTTFASIQPPIPNHFRRFLTTEGRLICLRVLGCMVAIGLVLLLVFYLRSADSLARSNERALIRNLRKHFSPEILRTEMKLLDSNAIPALSKALETKPGKIDKAYAWIWSRTPGQVRSNFPPPLDSATADQIRLNASVLLGNFKVGEFVPPSTLVKELRDPNWGVRMNALACLGREVLPKLGPDRLREEKGPILALVLAAAQDPKMEVRMSAVYCLGYFKEAPDRVTPVLSKALTDDYPDVRVRAAIAFYRLDPAQAEKRGALNTLFDSLPYNSPFGSRYVAEDFLRKEGKLGPIQKP